MRCLCKKPFKLSFDAVEGMYGASKDLASTVVAVMSTAGDLAEPTRPGSNQHIQGHLQATEL